MPIFTANTSLLYTEVDFLERFELASKDGFDWVEFQYPYSYPSEQIVESLNLAGTKLSLMNSFPGNDALGERGIAIFPQRRSEFLDQLEISLDYLLAFDCPRIHVMAGIAPQDHDYEELMNCYLDNIIAAAELFRPHNIDVLIEPINTQDMPGYFINYQDEAITVIEQLNLHNVRLQMDFYHLQMMEGNITQKLVKYFEHIGHIQIAGVPGRHEPSIGEINYPFLFHLLDEMDYTGHVGCEYHPKAGTSSGLSWLRDFQ